MNESTIYKLGILPFWSGLFEFYRRNNKKCTSLASNIFLSRYA